MFYGNFNFVVRIFSSSYFGFFALYGGRPYSISYIVTPNDHISHFELNFYLANICGAIYNGEPKKVKKSNSSTFYTVLANPKSEILITPLCIRKLAGLISR